jgi:hypothetical protein
MTRPADDATIPVALPDEEADVSARMAPRPQQACFVERDAKPHSGGPAPAVL